MTANVAFCEGHSQKCTLFACGNESIILLLQTKLLLLADVVMKNIMGRIFEGVFVKGVMV